MALTRRELLKLGVASSIAITIGPRVLRAMELMPGGESHNYLKITERISVPYTTWEAKIRNSGLAFIESGKIVQLSGNPNHITTRGRLTAQESAAYLQVYDQDRIIYPLKRIGDRGAGKWKRISWDEAIGSISEKITTLIDNGRNQDICLVTGRDSSGGAWKRFMHTLGTNSIFRQDSIGDLNKKTAMLNTWGAEIETPDFANSKYIIIFGSNPFDTFQPYAQQIADGRIEKRSKLVTFDVRVSNTSGLSDEWVPVFPGTDGIVALAMANVIMSSGLADTEFINKWTNYPADKLANHLKQFTPEVAEKASGVPAKDIIRIAKEFATTKPASIFTYRGVSAHPYGVYSERACMLLPIITGNIENKGGYCLPRYVNWLNVEPAPPVPKIKLRQVFPLGDPGYLFPFRVRDGEIKAGILFNYMTNPVYSSPAANMWRETLKDSSVIPFIVDFSPFMSETALYADIILPDAHYLERTESDTSPSLFPWIGLRQPVVKPMGEAKETREALKMIIENVDTDGSRGMKKYWGFIADGWMKGQLDEIPGFKKAGGYEALKENGVWPIYGKIDPKTKKIVDKSDNPVEAEYGIHRKKGFDTPSGKIEIYSKGFEKQGLQPLPTWKQIPLHKDIKKDELILVTYKAGFHINSITANTKYLSEMLHSNPVHINKETAKEFGIEDGVLVRIISPVGYMVTKARTTISIHPKVAAISSSFGHLAYGRVAKAKPKDNTFFEDGLPHDKDIRHNLWWNDSGVNPNEIIPVIPDPICGGQGWSDVVITIEPAKAEDRYGDIQVDNAKHIAFYKKMLELIHES
ncbi:MAG: molybdopterin-dependent oxidoreductase [Deltaproteobacteria bacterium]|nr:molybdopterin-dependent oxidoreductase [Deltaproteobacteria bacterium]